MSRPFNPYHKWLGLGDSVAEPNHFELLGLDESEDNVRTIAAAADRAASRVRGCRPGEHAAEWAALLDRISSAKKCLIDSRLRSEYQKSLQNSKAQTPEISKNSPRAAAPAAATVDPNMYPPGRAPAQGPAPATPKAPVQAPAHTVTHSPMALIEVPNSNASQAVPMLPAAELAMSPAGVPYLQPADAIVLPDPMHPAVPDASAFSPMTPLPMAPVPLAPPPITHAIAASVPSGAHPMAAIPMAIPLPASGIPTSQAIPLGSKTPTLPAQDRNLPTSTPPLDSWAINTNVAAKESPGGWLGPALLGLVAGILILSLGIGYVFWQSRGEKSGQVATIDPETIKPMETFADGRTEGWKVSATVDALPDNPAAATEPAAAPDAAPPIPIPARQPADPPKAEIKPAQENKPVENKPVENKPVDPKPTENKPPENKPPVPKPTTDPKPAMDTKSVPATNAPTKSDELPRPTAEELSKLGRAMKKAREAISEHNFDRADAFISAAADMPRLPEHQAMLDRLKLLSTSVAQYRKAIQESIRKLEPGSTFNVGEATIAVVETGPEKVILRVNGQNRSYVVRDLPFGLATAIAEQSLVPDDPTTIALKGAYVLANPRATEEDLKKAGEYLQQASGTVEAAKDLLLLLKDQYDLASKP